MKSEEGSPTPASTRLAFAFSASYYLTRGTTSSWLPSPLGLGDHGLVDYAHSIHIPGVWREVGNNGGDRGVVEQ